MAVDVIATVG